MNRLKTNRIPKQVPEHGEVGQRDVGRPKERLIDCTQKVWEQACIVNDNDDPGKCRNKAYK